MESLGINPMLVVAQVISFSILFFVLKKFLYSKIGTALEERRNVIKKTFDLQEELEKKLADFSEKQQKDLQLGREETKRLIAEARKEASRQKEEILNKARLEREMEVNKAEKQIEQVMAKSKKDLVGYVKDLSREVVERTLAEKTSDRKWQTQQLERSLRELKNAVG